MPPLHASAGGRDIWHFIYGFVGAFLGALGWRMYRRRFASSAA
jgi:hypothetical protein